MTHRVKDLPYEMQPRAQVKYLGVDGVQPDVLLAVLLRKGVPGRNALETARDLLQKFGSLETLATATWQSILAQRIAGIGEVAAMVIASAFELQRRASDGQHKNVLKELHSIEDVVELLYARCRVLDQETLFVIPVNDSNQMVTAPIAMATGKRHSVDFDLSKILEIAIRFSSDKIILVHNHPTGDPSPSQMDVIQTKRILEAGRLMGIEVIDHIVIGKDNPKGFSILGSGLISR